MPLPLFLDFIFLFADGSTIFIDLFAKPKSHLSVFCPIGRKTPELKMSVKKSSRYQLQDKGWEMWQGFQFFLSHIPHLMKNLWAG